MTDNPAFLKCVDLAAERLNGQVCLANDEFFAAKENLIKPGRGVFIEDRYTDHGKWMDGWETRRRREPGHDWCIIKLGQRGRVLGFDIDTNHFLGNHAPFASVEGADLDPEAYAGSMAAAVFETAEWFPLLSKKPLNPGAQNLFASQEARLCNFVRLNIFPDGGIARFRVYGEVCPDWQRLIAADEPIDLAAIQNGGRVLCCNDMFFSSKDNLIMPGRGVNMADGWETKRKREALERPDWVVLKLGRRGRLSSILIDTRHFKGNYPDRFSLEGYDGTEEPGAVESADALAWETIVPETRLAADSELIVSQLERVGPFRYVRLNIFPDGGVSRLRLWGHLVTNGEEKAGLERGCD